MTKALEVTAEPLGMVKEREKVSADGTGEPTALARRDFWWGNLRMEMSSFLPIANNTEGFMQVMLALVSTRHCTGTLLMEHRTCLCPGACTDEVAAEFWSGLWATRELTAKNPS